MIPAFMLRLRRVNKNTFFINALYLMLATLIVAGSGFIFWVLVARSYDVATVGLATTLLSVSSLLSLLGLVGFDTTFVRFLPNARSKNDYVNSGFTIVAFTSGGLAACVAWVLPFVLPNLSLLSDDWTFAAFVFFTIVSSLTVLINAVFLAHKRARYIFIICALFGACKIILPFFAPYGNAMTILTIAGLAQVIALVVGVIWLNRAFGYKFSVLFDAKILRVVRKFSFSMYASSVLNLLPQTILPLLVVHLLGPANAAYYYMAFTIAGALYTIAYASMQSVFAEGSHNQAALRTYVVNAAKLVGLLLLPASLLVAVVNRPLLAIFGPEYSNGAGGLLALFALGALPVATYSAMGAIFKITKNLRGIVCMNIVYAATILALSFWLMPRIGLVAVGWSWLAGNILACSVGLFFLIRKKGGV